MPEHIKRCPRRPRGLGGLVGRSIYCRLYQRPGVTRATAKQKRKKRRSSRWKTHTGRGWREEEDCWKKERHSNRRTSLGGDRTRGPRSGRTMFLTGDERGSTRVHTSVFSTADIWGCVHPVGVHGYSLAVERGTGRGREVGRRMRRSGRRRRRRKTRIARTVDHKSREIQRARDASSILFFSLFPSLSFKFVVVCASPLPRYQLKRTTPRSPSRRLFPAPPGPRPRFAYYFCNANSAQRAP